jgi:hypothetical protein
MVFCHLFAYLSSKNQALGGSFFSAQFFHAHFSMDKHVVRAICHPESPKVEPLVRPQGVRDLLRCRTA